MDVLVRIAPVLLLVGTALNFMFGIGLWMLKNKWEVDGKKSIKSQVEDMGAEFARKHKEIKAEVKYLTDDITRIHAVASDNHSEIQVKIGRQDERLYELVRVTLPDMRRDIGQLKEGRTVWLRAVRHRTHVIRNGVNAIMGFLRLQAAGIKPNFELKDIDFDSTDDAALDEDV